MTELFSSLNAGQKAAATHKTGPLLIVAGAGTGKTTVVTQRMLWLLHHPDAFGRALEPEEILALTFTDKASIEMEDRVIGELPIGYRELWISTFHALSERLLRAHAYDIGLSDDFRLLTPTQAWALMKRHEQRFDLEYYRPKGTPTKFFHAMIRHFSRAKDEGVGPEEYMQFVESQQLNTDDVHTGGASAGEGDHPLDRARLLELARAYATYEQVLRDENAIDFGGLLVWCWKLLKERPNILERYRKQFKTILVDEFQDTNWIQYEIVKLLAAPNFNITVVADDDQAIYRWRGASFNNVIQFKKGFPAARTVSLVENYRSGQNILDLAYAFIQKNNPNRLEAFVEGNSLGLGIAVSKRLISRTQSDAVVQHLTAPDVGGEARAVIEQILHYQKSCTTSVGGKPFSFADCAILVRSNSDARPFIRAFEHARIPYELVSNRGLYRKPIVVDTLAYLDLLDNYHESASLYRVMSMPVFGITTETRAQCLWEARKRSESLWTVARRSRALGVAREQCDRLDQLVAMVERHTRLAATEHPAAVLVAFYTDSGLVALWRSESATVADRADLSYAEQFYRAAEEYDRGEVAPTIEGFRLFVRWSVEAGDDGQVRTSDQASPDAVRILTVHAAKGLEFPVVFVVSMVDRRFPTTERSEPLELPEALLKEILPEGDWHLQEERRLMYVAITRAKQRLFFTSSEDYGGTRKKKPSIFLYELGLVEKKLEFRIKNKEKEPASFTIVSPTSVARDSKFEILDSHLPKYFSFTQLKAFESCPLQYKFAHILKIPVRGKSVFSFGKSMHKTLERYFKLLAANSGQATLFAAGSTASAPSLDVLLRLYEESWLNEWYENSSDRDRYFETGKKILREFYRLHDGKWPTPRYLEHPFSIKFGAHEVRGVIDRVDTIREGSPAAVEVVDYKTGTVPSGDSIPFNKKEQLLLYQIAIERLFHEHPEQLSYYYLEENKKVSFIGSDKDLEKVEVLIIETIEKIRASDFAATPDPMICKFCDFRQICEFRAI